MFRVNDNEVSSLNPRCPHFTVSVVVDIAFVAVVVAPAVAVDALVSGLKSSTNESQ